jgi:translation initiation factor 1A
MPKDQKSKKNSDRKPGEVVKGDLPLKVDGSVYGQVTSVLGDCNFRVLCFDGRERMCHLRKGAKKGERAVNGVIVLVCLRDYQDDKGDIIHVYTKDQTVQLRQQKLIPTKISTNEETEVDTNDDEETGFDFGAI